MPEDFRLEEGIRENEEEDMLGAALYSTTKSRDCEDGLEILFVPRHELALSQFYVFPLKFEANGYEYVWPPRGQRFIVAEICYDGPRKTCGVKIGTTPRARCIQICSHRKVLFEVADFGPGRQFFVPVFSFCVTRFLSFSDFGPHTFLT